MNGIIYIVYIYNIITCMYIYINIQLKFGVRTTLLGLLLTSKYIQSVPATLLFNQIWDNINNPHNLPPKKCKKYLQLKCCDE